MPTNRKAPQTKSSGHTAAKKPAAKPVLSTTMSQPAAEPQPKPAPMPEIPSIKREKTPRERLSGTIAAMDSAEVLVESYNTRLREGWFALVKNADNAELVELSRIIAIEPRDKTGDVDDKVSIGAFVRRIDPLDQHDRGLIMAALDALANYHGSVTPIEWFIGRLLLAYGKGRRDRDDVEHYMAEFRENWDCQKADCERFVRDHPEMFKSLCEEIAGKVA